MDAEQDARSLAALDLRLAGASYRQIALQLQVSVGTAFHDVQRMIHEHAAEPAEEVRMQELARLDRLMLAHWPKAVAGDREATRMVLAIMDRRARYLGLDAPIRIDHTAWIRTMAEENGLDPEQAVRDAQAILGAV